MSERLSRAVENAEVAKWCLYWSIVLKKVTANISGKYQKFMATKGDANAMVFSSKPTAIACVANDGRRFTKRVIKKIIDKNITNILAEKTPLWSVFAKAGIKTCVNAPSAKILRKRFGSLKAMKNISLYTLAPRAEAVNKSRMNPKILENNIPKLFVNIALNIIVKFT